MGSRIAARVVAAGLAAIAALHVLWGIRGELGRSVTIPEIDGRPLFVPTRLACFAVAGLLAAAAWVLLVGSGYLPDLGVPWLATVGPAAVGLVLLARAVGDFRYVGFFKTVRESRFAVLDTWFYSPLCALLALGALWTVAGRGR
jgi:hypothetical protein